MPSPLSWRSLPMRLVMAEFYDGPHATPAPAEEGPIYLGIGNLREDGLLDLGRIRHISETDYAAWTRRVEPRPGDLVFTYEASLHRYAIIPEGFRGCLGRRTALIRPDPEIVNTRFLLYSFLSPQWRHGVQQRMNIGSTVDRIPLVDFPNFPITLPDLATQHKIASILSAYDDLIENNTRRIRILEEMAQAIYREWFVEFRFPGHEGTRMVDSALGPIPEGWEVRKLSEVAKVIMGQSPPSNFYNETGEGLPFHQGVTNFGKHFPTHKAFSTSGDRRAGTGDILFSVRAPVGRINVADRDLILGRGVCAIRPSPAVAMCVLFQLKHIFQKEDIIGSGSIFNAVKRSDMENLALIWAPEELVTRFGEMAAPMFSLIKCLTFANVALRQTRDLLLPRLISGEIDVSDLDLGDV